MNIGGIAAKLHRKGKTRLAITPKAETSTQNIFFWSTLRIYPFLHGTDGIKTGLIPDRHTEISSVANDGMDAGRTETRGLWNSAQLDRVTLGREHAT